MNKELEFAKTLEEVKDLAKGQGNCVSEEQVKEAFDYLELNEEQLQMVFDYLVKHKVGIGQPVDLDSYLTNEEKNYLEEYLKEIEELPVYSEGELKGYTISAMAGDGDAINKIVEAHLRDVTQIAKLYSGQGILLEDLIGEGNVALAFGATMLGSLERPEEAEGMLAKMIMDAMEEYIAEHAAEEKQDQKIADKVNKVMDKARELSDELKRKVSVDELVEESGLSKKTVLDAIRMSGNKIEYIE